MQELNQQEIPTLEGIFIPAGNRKEKIFIASDTESAYSQMISFISWVKPIQFEGSFGNTTDGREAARLIYVRG